MISKVSFILVLLVLPALASSQTPRRPRPTPKPTPTQALQQPALATLSIEAGLVFDNGDVKPVARTKFYLLDEDLALILSSIGVTLGGGTPITRGSHIQFERAFNEGINQKMVAAIAPHILSEVTTDFSGKAKFESVPPGVRFVYGEYSVERSLVLWNTRVELKPGTKVTLTLDNSN